MLIGNLNSLPEFKNGKLVFAKVKELSGNSSFRFRKIKGKNDYGTIFGVSSINSLLLHPNSLYTVFSTLKSDWVFEEVNNSIISDASRNGKYPVFSPEITANDSQSGNANGTGPISLICYFDPDAILNSGTIPSSEIINLR